MVLLVRVMLALGFLQNRLDVAFFLWWHSNGQLAVMALAHVDDIALAHDGSPEALAVIAELRVRFPFGACGPVPSQVSPPGLKHGVGGNWLCG